MALKCRWKRSLDWSLPASLEASGPKMSLELASRLVTSDMRGIERRPSHHRGNDETRSKMTTGGSLPGHFRFALPTRTPNGKASLALLQIVEQRRVLRTTCTQKKVRVRLQRHLKSERFTPTSETSFAPSNFHDFDLKA